VLRMKLIFLSDKNEIAWPDHHPHEKRDEGILHASPGRTQHPRISPECWAGIAEIREGLNSALRDIQACLKGRTTRSPQTRAGFQEPEVQAVIFKNRQKGWYLVEKTEEFFI